MTLRLFTEYGAASRNEATLRKNKQLFLSHTLAKQCGFKDHKYAIIYIDDNDKKIGLKFTNDEENYIRKIMYEKSGISIDISPILRFYGITEIKERKYLTLYPNGEIPIIKL